MAVLVSGVKGVEASTQTSPVDSLIAVDRPPNGKIPNRVKGLPNGWVSGSSHIYIESILGESCDFTSHLEIPELRIMMYETRRHVLRG